jgi:hypothetical protein
VTERDRRSRGELVVLDVEIRAADARRRDLEHDMPGACSRLGPLGERDVPGARRELRDPEHRHVDELARA